MEQARKGTGVVIPVCFPHDMPSDAAAALLMSTARDFLGVVAGPAAVCLSIDGPGPGVAAGRRAGGELGVQVIESERNRGKFRAVQTGMARLLDDEDLHYLAVVDQDGDHFASELANVVRAARHVESCESAERVMVLGRRISRHRPLGFLRGELEELADRMLLDALRYDAALCGRPLRMQFATTLDEFPDFHSGYKLFTRATAVDVFLTDPPTAGLAEECWSRHAVEAVITVEAMKAGAHLAAVNRSTLDEQPTSTFGLLDLRRLVADKIIWPCKRLDVPPQFVEQWMHNHLPRLLLGSFLPEGRDELLGVWRLVMEAFGMSAEQAMRTDPLTRPEFI